MGKCEDTACPSVHSLAVRHACVVSRYHLPHHIVTGRGVCVWMKHIQINVCHNGLHFGHTGSIALPAGYATPVWNYRVNNELSWDSVAAAV
jgi:hypothetical protein